MATAITTDLALRCACGAVECGIDGPPISTAVCYCDDCQEAARQIEALGNGPAITDADGGTALSLVRKDRFTIRKGADLLRAHKLKPDTVTNRYVTTCCNSALYLGFDKGPFWVSVMRNRFAGAPLPPVAMRIQAKYRTSSLPYPDDAPVYQSFPKSFVARLMWEWVKMLVRGRQ